MNEKNLIPFTKRTPREHSKLSKIGAKRSNEVQKKKKEEAKQNEKLVDILKKVIFSEVKSEVVKKKIKELGIEGSNYFTALCAVSTTKAMQKGDFNVIFKMIELIDKSNLNTSQTEESESFNNLIGAIKNVRKIEPEAEWIFNRCNRRKDLILSYKSSDDKYLSWYRDFVINFHKYYIYNGERQVFKNRYSLNLAKKICENFADFLMNEKVRITLGTDKNTKIINDLLRKNNNEKELKFGDELWNILSIPSGDAGGKFDSLSFLSKII